MAGVNFKVTLCYEGTDFHGWQMQKSDRTVQQAVERALGDLHGTGPIKIWGAGRTDAGVHARGQVMHTKLKSGMTPDKLVSGLNALLPDDVRAIAAEQVDDDFHARFGATARRYSYTMTDGQIVIGRRYIWNLTHAIDGGLLGECAAEVIGDHDFAGFVKANSDVESTICRIHMSRWEHEGRNWTYHIMADRFLHHMVRYLVGTMVEVARGRVTAAQFRSRLSGNLDALQIYSAPAKGLVLEEVIYDPIS